MRVVRLRPGLIFKAEAAAEIRRFFLGSRAPSTSPPSRTSARRSSPRCCTRWQPRIGSLDALGELATGIGERNRP
jgi:hypothetical protein